MTARPEYVGRVGLLVVHRPTLSFPVRVVDACDDSGPHGHVYGSLRFLVEPMGGNGRAWVSASRVTLSPVGEVQS